MSYLICVTCGVQYESIGEAPATCKICEEERQYVNPDGQAWTTLEELIEKGTYRNAILQEEQGLHSIRTEPGFAIGQTAYLVQGSMNVLWDCITYLDDPTIAHMRELGGIDAIALSHPHYYSTQALWAETFGCPLYIHEDDKQWVARESRNAVYWSGDRLELSDDLVLHRLGGHFKGGAVLNWTTGNEGKGVLLTGDIIQVVADRRWVSFMYSYPNLIPLPANKVRQIADRVRDIPFDRIYNAFHRVVKDQASRAVQASADRYIKALEGTWFET